MPDKTNMDNLESLSNDELRVRLLEYGFQNLPVTATTRSVLIKKLRNHIENEKKKTRRETVHVTKYSSDEEESDAKNPADTRRTTIGVVGKMKAPNKTSIRRSGRITPTVSGPTENVTLKPSVPDIIEDTDEEEVVKITRRSSSRTPTSLKKDPPTPVVRHIKTTLMEVVEDSSENESRPEPEPQRSKSRSPVKLYDGVFNRYGIGSSHQFNNQLAKSHESSSISSIKKRMTFTSGGAGESNYASPIYGESKYSSLYSSPARASISTSYNNYEPTSSSLRNSLYRYTAAKPPPEQAVDDHDNEDDDFEEEENHTPIPSKHLNQFSRRLSQLRAEPIVPDAGDYRKSSVTSYRRAPISTRANIREDEDSLFYHFKTLWASLNHKYSINFYLFMAFAVLIAIFLVVIFLF